MAREYSAAQIEAKRSQMQEEAVANVHDTVMTRIITTEEAKESLEMATKDEQQDAQIGLLNERFAGLEGHLFGRDGTNGAFGDLKIDIKHILRLQEKASDDVRELCEKHSTDIQEVRTDMALQKKDVNAIGEISRGNRDTMIKLQSQKGVAMKEFWKKVFYSIIPILIGAIGIALWAGIKSLLQ